MSEHYHPIIELDLIRAGLEREEKRQEALDHLNAMVRFRIGQKVRYQLKNSEEWTDGVIIAFMVYEPRYIVGPFEDRDECKGQLWGILGDQIQSREPEGKP